MLKDLKEQVWQANLKLVEYKLVTLTWGNVSGIDRKKGMVAIKPSGVDYEKLKAADIIIVDLDGKLVEGKLNPSSDTPTHLELYKAFEKISAIAHTHSEYATMFAQAGKEIVCMGTTHADYFLGNVPLTRFLSEQEVNTDYEGNTGKIIVERFQNLDTLDIPGILVAGHGPFSWGDSALEAVKHSLILETVARMALGTLLLNQAGKELPGYILNKHYQRKHGPDAYYGQKT